MSNKFYITTAIDYVNSAPHIGTAYEKIGADVIARFMKLDGFDVHFQMGNDEHSINVKKAADAKGISPQKYCDQMKKEFENIWNELDISYNGFIQTSEERHLKGVQKLFSTIEANGDIYKAHYEGWYCESCEAYLTQKDLVNGLCPNHKSKPALFKEENYFFALSKYRDKLLNHIKKHPEFILPDIRRNEILSLLNEGLEDISVSRASFPWGVPLPNDPSHVVYVWVDALINYITAIGFTDDEKEFKKWWPADIHMIGKDITRFHCVIWPAMLMSAGIKLPKTIFGHGFVSLNSEKMSKTLGNVVTPSDVIKDYGSDALRYYLLREGSFGRDSDFTWDNFIKRYNGDLANELGNLVSRTIGMASKYLNSKVTPPSSKLKDPLEDNLKKSMLNLLPQIRDCLDFSKNDINFHNALSIIWEAMAHADRYINELKPWEIAKAENSTDKINSIIYHLTESLRIISLLLTPFMPKTAESIWNRLGLNEIGNFKDQRFSSIEKWGGIKKEITLKTSDPLFLRTDIKVNTDKPKQKEVTMDNTTSPIQQLNDQIDISEFAKIDLRVAEILSAEQVEGADKLLKINITLGNEKRQIVAGIAQHYKPEELVGKKVVVVANLKPAKIRGVESRGMLLAASDENTISILTPLKDVSVGSKVK